jgi:hypothetical protein
MERRNILNRRLAGIPLIHSLTFMNVILICSQISELCRCFNYALAACTELLYMLCRGVACVSAGKFEVTDWSAVKSEYWDRLLWTTQTDYSFENLSGKDVLILFYFSPVHVVTARSFKIRFNIILQSAYKPPRFTLTVRFFSKNFARMLSFLGVVRQIPTVGEKRERSVTDSSCNFPHSLVP